MLSTKMASAITIFMETKIPQQKQCSNNDNSLSCFPPVLVPSSPICSLSQLIEAIKIDQREGGGFLESLLLKTGAILFRGFETKTTAKFNDVVEAFGYEELLYIGGPAPRTHVVGRVYTANESPPDQLIPFHHEMVMVPEPLSKVFFFCEVEPRSGGETPIVLSHVIYDKMKEQHPEFVEKLEEYGPIYCRGMGADDDPSSSVGRGWKSIYCRGMGADDDPSSSVGRGWKSTFSTNDKFAAKQRFISLTF